MRHEGMEFQAAPGIGSGNSAGITGSMLIARYIFRQTASAVIMILVSLVLIVWLSALLRDLKLLTSQGHTFYLFLKITALGIPKILVIIAPVAFLIASLHTLNRLNGDSELIVLSAAGSSAWRLLTPYLALGSLVGAAILAANILVLPPADKLFNDYISQIRADVVSQLLQPGEFTDLESGLTFHMRGRAQNGDLLGVVVRDERDKAAINTIIAERGQIRSDSGRNQMDLYDGQILRQQMERPNAQFIAFSSYSFDLGDFSAKSGKRQQKIGELSLHELFYVDKDSKLYREEGALIASEIHRRFSTPLYSLVYAFLAVVYLGRPRTTREGRVSLLFTSFLIGAIVLGVGIGGVNGVGKQFWTSIALIYGVPFGVTLSCALLLLFNIPAPALSLPSIRLNLPFRGKNAGAAA
jgi:lipopolysaccharide export system permease protein